MTEPIDRLSRRERQIMDVLVRLGRATVADVHREVPDPPSSTAIRSALWLLERKGHVSHEQEGACNVYRASATLPRLRQAAVTGLVRNLFGGSRSGAVAAILGSSRTSLTTEEVERIEALLAEHRKRRKER
jgi:BlaI family transcriptional regulator, penicillinase repressor